MIVGSLVASFRGLLYREPRTRTVSDAKRTAFALRSIYRQPDKSRDEDTIQKQKKTVVTT